jgi:hypothetical protein
LIPRSRAKAFELGTPIQEVERVSRTRLATRYSASGKVLEEAPTKVHSWKHSYPHGKPKRGFDNYIEVNGKGRTWASLKDVKRDLGRNFVLVYRGCLGVWEVVDEEPIDCT